MLSFKTLALGLLPALTLAKPTLPPPARDIYQAEAGRWFENIAVRPNGNLLATSLFPSADIFTVSNPSSKKPSTEILVTLPDEVSSILGITQVETTKKGEEKFVVVAGEFLDPATVTPRQGSWKAYSLTFNKQDRPIVKKVSDLSPNTTLPNGATSLAGLPNVVFFADGGNGFVGRLDISTGRYEEAAFQFPEFLTVPGAPLAIGVNGIRTRNGYLYFSNTATVSIYRIRVTPQGYPASTPELVADLSSLTPFVDDFNFDARGNIFAATYEGNVIVRVDGKTGKARAVVGGVDEETVATSTSLAFGRGRFDREYFYVVTGEGRIIAVNTKLIGC